MSLRELSLQSEYRSDKADLVKDFYTPCLRNATQYCRAVAYFSSNGLALNVKGLSTFIRHGGQMSLVTGPKLMSDDIEAIQRGYSAKEQNLDTSLDCGFEAVFHDRLMLLAWLIANGHLDIKIACPSDLNTLHPHAVYHEKTGVFLDENDNAVAFSGSSNETVGGLLNNFESIDVHWSWDDTQERVQQKVNNFKRLWDNNTDKLEVIDFLNALAEKLLVRQTVYETEQAGTTDKPEIIEQIVPYLPKDIVLRKYQSEAIDAWFKNGCRGLWEMATGTGKTITALSALAKLRNEQEHLFILVACPYQHLVDQWYEEAVRFGFEPILAYKSSASWVNPLNTALVRYNYGVRDIVCTITTQTTFISETMQRLLSKLKRCAVLVADEVHHLGAERSRKKLTDIFNYRLGLSATPNRWFDESGTTALRTYFGDTVYEFSLAKAIKMGYLCPYYYHPHLIELTDEEFEEYERLTERISKLYHQVESSEISEALERLLIKRATLLNRAENKLTKLAELLTDKTDSLHHTLFYCAPGRIAPVLELLTNLGLRVAKFTAQESTAKRQELLKMFTSGHLQALVAMKCLDEGVDVPSTRTAYILASSSNPKEFIQRRGRILRQSPGKEHAEIHDLIAVPPIDYRQHPTATFHTERKIVGRELERFNEFAGMALNKFEACDKIWELAKKYNLLGALGVS
ncbi:MAG: DEAD/DEAH box helicase family protein [Candidatus Poribacteria bacterium]|nr:DEAD/DEAH box helicase family protein [Candidatus Poribacteria bacterium]